MIDLSFLNPVQHASYSLIRSDLRFLYTVLYYQIIKNSIKSNFISSLIPYLGVVIDGAEKWVKAINNSQKYSLSIPQFSGEEKKYYAQIRNSIKLWQNEYPTIYETMNKIYC